MQFCMLAIVFPLHKTLLAIAMCLCLSAACPQGIKIGSNISGSQDSTGLIQSQKGRGILTILGMSKSSYH